MSEYKKEKVRPTFPKRAVVTAGMPYGNKELHFGHVGGMFVHADVFARFLRDRIGKENVIFVSGTDCYGSPIMESYRKLKPEGSVHDYVESNHIKQKESLKAYEMSLDLFGASALGRSGEIHNQVSAEIFEKLYEKGWLEKLETTQFYDPDYHVFLNGRQVVGKCPFEGCQSEHAYADECDLGHQYMPSDLIDPKSTLSGKTPLMKKVSNWYFKLENCTEMLRERNEELRKSSATRKYVLTTINEFLEPPVIHVQRKQIEDLALLEVKLPKHKTIDEEKKPSIVFVFENLDDRDAAKDVLASLNIRYRTGKTLVPFRLSGNIEWGVPVPTKEDIEGLTFWVWPESLWAPISFTKTYLEQKGAGPEEWKKYWNNEEACVYQFIGEDNIYFYGIAEMAMFQVLFEEEHKKAVLPQLIANRHILFMDKKASSSSEIKPPMANDLLAYYTPEQLRMHFLSLGLANKSSSFMPQVYMPEDQRVGADVVVKDGNLLTNVYNRLVRSCLYLVQSDFEGHLPEGSVSEKVLNLSKEAILKYEEHMYRNEFHAITYVLDSYIREMNKLWANTIKNAADSVEVKKQLLIDCFYGIRVAASLLHPIAPVGCEKVREYLNVDERIWSWDYIFSPLNELMEDPMNHKFKFLEPRVDFFQKHESQFAQEK